MMRLCEHPRPTLELEQIVDQWKSTENLKGIVELARRRLDLALVDHDSVCPICLGVIPGMADA